MPVRVTWPLFHRMASGDPVEALLRYFGVMDAPVPVQRMVRELGIPLGHLVDGEGPPPAGGVVHVRAPIQEAHAGLIWRDATSDPVILLHQNLEFHTARYWLAHELGHVMLELDRQDHWCSAARYHRTRNERYTTEEIRRQEVDAYDFAMKLLMPYFLLAPHMRDLRSHPHRVADTFQVPLPALRHRAEELFR